MKYLSLLILLTIFSCQTKKEGKENNTTAKTSNKKSAAAETFECAHCGMPTEEFPKWQCKLHLVKGERRTCSPRCMFITHLKGEAQDIKELKVIEYYSQKEIDAKKAFYVIGSDIVGPMGHDLVPLATEDDAKSFTKEHLGKNILNFDEVNLEIIEKLKTN